MDLGKDAGSSWQPCDTGEVGGLVKRLRRQRRRGDVWRAAVTGTCLAAVALLAFWMLPGQREAGAAITCREVHDLADAYVAGQVEAEKSDRIRRHLDHCRTCREVVDRLRPGEAAVLDGPVPCPANANDLVHSPGSPRSAVAFRSSLSTRISIAQ